MIYTEDSKAVVETFLIALDAFLVIPDLKIIISVFIEIYARKPLKLACKG
jgi:hypothetical protein